jgi:23S rRNA (adenine2503-C2)-methyltransferase
MDRGQLAAALNRYGVPAFHAGQVYRWLYARQAYDPDRWTDLSLELRSRLRSDVHIGPGLLGARTTAADGTVKYEVLLHGGGAVEAVFMVQRGRITLCLSSQVGCALACEFCLTGKMGWARNLSAGEIVGQVALICGERQLADRPFNVVLMGMGEPLHNYDAVLAAFRLLTDREGFGLSRRRITLSTAGMVDGIRRLAGEPSRPKLAVSLNATTDDVRDRIMPINRRYAIAELIGALRDYARTTGDPFTIEYVLLDGVNDSAADVTRLAALARDLPAKINLIPFNPVPGQLAYARPPRRRVVAIRDRLLAAGRRASIRWSRGAEARAACGQLALLGPARSRT